MPILIRSTNLAGFPEVVRGLGADPRPLMRRFGLTPGVEAADDEFVPWPALTGLLESTAQDLDCPDLGLRMGEFQGLAILGPLAVVVRNADTLGVGLEAIRRYLHVHSPALRLSAPVEGADDELRYVYRADDSGGPSRGDPGPKATTGPGGSMRQAYELAMANASHIVRLLSGDDTPPRRIYFLHPRGAAAQAYAAALRCPTTFTNPWCGFTLPRSLAGRRLDHSDPQTRKIATAYLETAYPTASARLSDQVGDLVRRLLPTGQCSQETVADALHLHPRTLQRRLAEEGTTFAQVLDGERREQAVRYLGEPELAISRIAGLLGYTEQSAFTRAFRRWFGTTPLRYRTAGR
ncbi:MAG: AraC family transcriptional regulator ligand-binding domain-containing protein [Actinomycetales bacterium]